jgi:hypothetical protein
MGIIVRLLLLGLSTLALGVVAACTPSTQTSSPAPSAPTTSASAPAVPASATYVADMEADGKKMTIGISVDGASVTAYACNGVDDEAWFFGNQTGGAIDLTSKFRDTLSASVVGDDVRGDLTMNGQKFPFTAVPVGPPAGVFTAVQDNVRSTWILRADGSAIGVQLTGISGRDFEQAELQQLRDDQFRAQVRNKRQLQQAAQLQRLQNGRVSSTINGKPVSPTRVTGGFRL